MSDFATEYQRVKTNISNAYDACEEKNATIPTTKNSANLASTIRSIPSSQGDVVNGIIEQYLASTNTIAANTFVEFVNGIMAGNSTVLSSTMFTMSYVSATLVDTNKVFIAHSLRSGNPNLYGIVCTISGTTIAKGTDTLIWSRRFSYASAVSVDTNKVFISYNGYNDNNTLYGIVCTISGTTITAGTGTQISSDQGSGYYSGAVKIDTNKVLITHSSDSTNSYLNGIICTISGTTITKGTDTQLSTTTNSSYYSSGVLIDTNKVFIAHGIDSTNYYLYGIVCTISGTTITKGTDTQLSNFTRSGYYPCVISIDTNKVFASHGDATNAGNLYGIVCTISGTSITKGTDTQLTTSNKMFAIDHKSVLIDTNKVAIISVEDSGSDGNMISIICTISGTTITKGTDSQLYSGTGTQSSTPTITTVLISTNKIFIGYGNDDYKLTGVVATEGKRITQATTKIEGLTKTQCTTDTSGEVWVLNN